MLRWKDVAKALADKNIRDMSFFERFSLVVHVMLCPFCGKFHKDVVKHQEMARCFHDHEEPNDEKMDDDAKKKLREALSKECK